MICQRCNTENLDGALYHDRLAFHRIHQRAHPRELRQVFSDENGRLYFETELGPGVLDDLGLRIALR